ncbi:hypothetical protein BABINDRAFT_166705 [Babjeviella inositovora NRRL Y-12698]|uniref:J domain-containing protein n=1 Tax=Babjeviella inositovora NRRL Y-12698 TaxID=984486 RepID=A0A1E3QTU8_9ASCO|nr:uncharacterized protein BABINDRAFT_166705 [Babjeviella inositovora NRRL Y-12698]ODQ80367.1 hypothetical protein BABINDRAFT_166705 [Babjeviella inositovora NRRL Y-12698]
MDRDLEEIIEKNVNLYQLLDITPYEEATNTKLDIPSALVKRQYRQKALLHHPDKQAQTSSTRELEENAVQFHFASLALKILTDTELKARYDSFYNRKFRSFQLSANDRAKYNEKQQGFKEALQREEADYNSYQSEWHLKQVFENRLNQLREEGLRKRRAMEKEIMLAKRTLSGAVLLDDMPLPPIAVSAKSEADREARTVKIKWLHREELKSLITPDIIKDMFSKFGAVDSCALLSGSSKRGTARLVFSDVQSAAKAVRYDYLEGNRGSQSLWFNTSYKKISSLLRDCKFVKEELTPEVQDHSNTKPASKTKPVSKTKPTSSTARSFVPFFNKQKYERQLNSRSQIEDAEIFTSDAALSFDQYLAKTMQRAAVFNK